MMYIIEVEDYPFTRRSLPYGEERIYRLKGTGITFTEGLLNNLIKMPIDREEAMLAGRDLAWSLAQNIAKYVTTDTAWKEVFGESFDEKPLFTIRFEEALERYQEWRRRTDS